MVSIQNRQSCWSSHSADEVSEKGDGKLRTVYVCPMDIGTDTHGGRMSTILVKGSEFLSSSSKSHVTTSNFQRSMTVRVYKGLRVKASEKKLIGTLNPNWHKKYP